MTEWNITIKNIFGKRRIKIEKNEDENFQLFMLNIYGSSRREVFYGKGVLRNFAKFTGKHLCQSLFFNKVAGLRPVAKNEVIASEIYHKNGNAQT